MKRKNKWLMQIIIPTTNYKFTIYDNGLVYGTNYNEKLFILNEEALNQIKKFIKRDIYMLKTLSYVKMKRHGLIIKLNYANRNRNNIKVVGWAYEKEILSIITTSSNYKKCFIN